MNLKTNKIFIILFFCLTLLFVFGLRVDAANASITLEKSTVEVGKPVKITVSGKGVQWNLKLKVDGEVLKTDSELENYEANKNINFSVTYTPKTAGTKNVILEGSVTEFSDGTTIKSFPSKSITVKEKTTTTTNNNNTTTNKDTNTTTIKTKSNNAYLKTLGVRITDSLAKELGVETNEYDFSGFSKTKTSYNVTVPKNVDSLKVFATAADSNATVKVSGNSGFEVGSNNKITIKVTAEDGKTTKTYTIKVTKLAEEEEKPGNLIEEETELYLTSLVLEGIELSPEFAKDTYSYTATLTDSTITELNVNAVANNEKANVEISGNKELAEGENTINIVLTLEDSSEQTVYQIVVTKEAELVSTNTSEDISTSSTDFIGIIKGYVGIAIGIVLLMIIVVIVLIILLRRENKKIKEEQDAKTEEDVETKEYNVYQNDENEFSNNEIEKDNFIESLYKQRNGNFDDEELNEQEKETLEEISKQTERIFKEKEIEGQSVEYFQDNFKDENSLEVRRKRRSKGKHSL